jgi:hypothetical protein
MARVELNSSFNEWGVTAAPGIALGAYLTIAVCLAAGFYWLMQPTVADKLGLPKTVATYAKSPWVPPALSEMPATLAIESPATEGVETMVVTPKKEMKSTVVAPKKKTKRREARRTRHREPFARERTNPFWGYASSPLYGYPRF